MPSAASRSPTSSAIARRSRTSGGAATMVLDSFIAVLLRRWVRAGRRPGRRPARTHRRRRTAMNESSTMVAAPPEVRDRLAIALDVGDLDAALGMARSVAPWFGVAKVGYELYG